MNLSIFVIAASLNAHAVVMEPTYQSAEVLGYQVVGEIEFTKNSITPPPMDKHLDEIGELCPRTHSGERIVSSFTKFVIMAWGDFDYPSKKQTSLPAHQQWLAQKRATEVAAKIQKNIGSPLNFELVNMANRKPHMIDNALPDRPARQDVKSTLETAGAAPSDALGYGLFAEYSQAAKAVIWVDCHESNSLRRGPSVNFVRLAALGQSRPYF